MAIFILSGIAVTTLAELLESLSYVELSDMNGASEGDGVVTSKWRNRLISIINSGLTVLYSGFSLRTNSLEVYPSYEPTVHIINNPDFIRIDKISYEGNQLYLNDTTISDPRVRIRSWNQFESSGFTGDLPLVVEYRARPELLTKNSPDETEIPLPARFDELLRAYLAWHIFAGYKDQGFMVKSQENKARYLELLQELRELNITNEYNPELPPRWFDKGWGLTPAAKLKEEF